MVNILKDEGYIWELLRKKAVLITPNMRLAHYFHQRYAEEESRYHAVFETPCIFSYEIWIKKLWDMLSCEKPFLINEFQSHCIWLNVVKQSAVFNKNGLIESVKKAWKLCCEWEIPLEKSLFSGNADTKAFFHWTECYKQYLDNKNALDIHQVPAYILSQRTLELQYPIIISGFDSLTPAFLKLLNIFSSVPHYIYEPNQPVNTVSKVSFLTDEEQIKVFVQWAKDKESVGCIVPNLTEKRKKIERFLSHQLKHYNISIGCQFSSYPMIEQALKILSLRTQSPWLIERKDFYFMLASPFVGLSSEEGSRFQVDRKFHILGESALSISSFINVLKTHDIQLGSSIEQFLALPLKERLMPSEWIVCFNDLLNLLNWPGHRSLDSVEYQVCERWNVLMKEYQQLDAVLEPIDFQKAFFYLKEMAQGIIFQPQTPEADIHVLGLLEGAGLFFDHLWVMDMNDDVLPAVPKPNPFIPYSIQKARNMPHVNAEKELEFANRLMQRFLKSGNEVVLSYLMQKDNAPALPSPLIENPPPALQAAPFEKEGLGGIFSRAVQMELLEDTELLPLTTEEAASIKGGVSLIKNQALCPFRAFATHRLSAKGFDKVSFGLNDMDRGSLVHKTLEHFWHTVKTQTRLLSLTQEEIHRILEEAVSRAVRTFASKKPDTCTSQFQKLESLRLEQILKDWVACEKQRPDFTVLSLEKQISLTLSSLQLNLRIDRIDQVNNGKKFVIDYKTGAAPPYSQDDERPEHPQLMLYALSDEHIEAAAFAEAKPSSSKFKGQASEDIGISGVNKIDWHTERIQWLERLTAVADEFVKGEVSVRPKHKKVCSDCYLHGLCRIQEKQLN